MVDGSLHSNIGMMLIWTLFENSLAMRQPEWINAAEFNCHKWKRYVLDHRYSDSEKISNTSANGSRIFLFGYF